MRGLGHGVPGLPAVGVDAAMDLGAAGPIAREEPRHALAAVAVDEENSPLGPGQP